MLLPTETKLNVKQIDLSHKTQGNPTLPRIQQSFPIRMVIFHLRKFNSI